ncbi:uncharacterized protein N7511_008434 [Penicillium nucicola]|uniref:uncharacterized protein n=1 Tax=Penicillium nucicola TaxID=1850975 RepID=UPI0025456C28|nr:uncharacterized protein N7511_008434 [Penicillium nucicola]KAJ5751469.1 hypothetical protein N7511_008434 [Penicillium nucicola]
MSSSICHENRLDQDLTYHLSLLKFDKSNDECEEALLAPMLTSVVLNQPALAPLQYGLLGGVKEIETPYQVGTEIQELKDDPRLFFNVSSPSSVFICGSQGSGKSHTLSCLLEGCLISSRAGRLLNPLTAVVFHYDTFICDNGGSPCEAAFLASNPNIKVRVLCAPTNLRTIQGTYSRFNIKVEPLQIDQSDLNTKRMLDLMAVDRDNGAVPLYLHTVQRILREMRLLQQSAGSQFNYQDFKSRILSSGLLQGQLEPLKQRLDTLESFMAPQQAGASYQMKGKSAKKNAGSSWTPKASQLTIVDLSCPCISPDTACSLFNVCFGIFMEQETKIGRIVALDEAHKVRLTTEIVVMLTLIGFQYMKDSVEAQGFTDTLLSTVRLQRHLGARILVSTQEPTISSDLLSLCSVAIVHRFSSPAWAHTLQAHVAAAALSLQSTKENQAHHEQEPLGTPTKHSIFHRIVHLQVGEALLFSPSAVISVAAKRDRSLDVIRLGSGYMTIKIRDRLTEDGGKSVISS